MTRPSIYVGLIFAANASIAGIQRQGPIATTPSAPKGSPIMASSSITASADKISGATASVSPISIQYADATPFGPSREGAGWLIRGEGRIQADSKSVTLILNTIVDASTGLVTAVYTDASGRWVEPMEAERNPEVTTDADGWVMGKVVPETMESTAADAIGMAWKEFGIDPTEVGQVIARPRLITAQFPARRVGDKLIPVRPTEKVWIVQVCGGKFNEMLLEGVEHYQTIKVMQFQDGTLTYVRGVFAP